MVQAHSLPPAWEPVRRAAKALLGIPSLLMWRVLYRWLPYVGALSSHQCVDLLAVRTGAHKVSYATLVFAAPALLVGACDLYIVRGLTFMLCLEQELVAPTSAVNLLQRRITPPRNGSCALTGVSVLVTCVDARQRCATLVQQLGGTLLADLPTTAEVRLRRVPICHNLLILALAPACTLIHPGSRGSGLPSACDHVRIKLQADANAQNTASCR